MPEVDLVVFRDLDDLGGTARRLDVGEADAESLPPDHTIGQPRLLASMVASKSVVQ